MLRESGRHVHQHAHLLRDIRPVCVHEVQQLCDHDILLVTGWERGYRHGFIPSFEHRKQAVDIRGTAHSYKFVITHSSELEW